MDNQLGFSSIGGEDLAYDLSVFAAMGGARAADKKKGHFLLYSMANSPPGEGITLAAKVVLEAGGTASIGECAAQYNVPNMTSWCPESLLDVGQLTNYYKQTAIAEAYARGDDFPNGFYIDAVDTGGRLRTGTRPLSAAAGAPPCDIYYWRCVRVRVRVCVRAYVRAVLEVCCVCV